MYSLFYLKYIEGENNVNKRKSAGNLKISNVKPETVLRILKLILPTRKPAP